jgi:hypothetical protein
MRVLLATGLLLLLAAHACAQAAEPDARPVRDAAIDSRHQGEAYSDGTLERTGTVGDEWQAYAEEVAEAPGSSAVPVPADEAASALAAGGAQGADTAALAAGLSRAAAGGASASAVNTFGSVDLPLPDGGDDPLDGPGAGQDDGGDHAGDDEVGSVEGAHDSEANASDEAPAPTDSAPQRETPATPLPSPPVIVGPPAPTPPSPSPRGRSPGPLVAGEVSPAAEAVVPVTATPGPSPAGIVAAIAFVGMSALVALAVAAASPRR